MGITRQERQDKIFKKAMEIRHNQAVENLIDTVRELMTNISDSGQDVNEEGKTFPDVQAVKDALKAL
jgi:hypothetical protein